VVDSVVASGQPDTDVVAGNLALNKLGLIQLRYANLGGAIVFSALSVSVAVHLDA
jgi:hypothetical protein